MDCARSKDLNNGFGSNFPDYFKHSAPIRPVAIVPEFPQLLGVLRRFANSV